MRFVQFLFFRHALGTYGKINNEGSVTETIGNISVTENGYEYESIN